MSSNAEVIANLRSRAAAIDDRFARARAWEPLKDFYDGQLVGEIDLGRASLRVSVDVRRTTGATVVCRLYGVDHFGRMAPRYAIGLPLWACGQFARVFADALDRAAGMSEPNAAQRTSTEEEKR